MAISFLLHPCVSRPAIQGPSAEQPCHHSRSPISLYNATTACFFPLLDSRVVQQAHAAISPLRAQVTPVARRYDPGAVPSSTPDPAASCCRSTATQAAPPPLISTADPPARNKTLASLFPPSTASHPLTHLSTSPMIQHNSNPLPRSKLPALSPYCVNTQAALLRIPQPPRNPLPSGRMATSSPSLRQPSPRPCTLSLSVLQPLPSPSTRRCPLLLCIVKQQEAVIPCPLLPPGLTRSVKLHPV